MTVTTFIDQDVGHNLNLSASDSDNTDQRTRSLERLTEVLNYVYDHRDWRFRHTSTTVTVTTLNYATIGTDFGRIGQDEGVYLASNGMRLDAVTMRDIEDMRALTGASTNTPTAYCISGQDTQGDYYIQLPTLSGSVSLTVYYTLKSPTLTEGASPDLLQRIPVHYHQSVLMAGVRAMTRNTVADSRYNDFRTDRGFLTALCQMVREESHGGETTGQLPGFFGA